jgi:hypothetical protein
MVKLFVAGDVVNYQNESGLLCSKEMEAIIKSTDYAICNFEAPLADSGVARLKSGSHHSQRIETVSGLKSQGFDLLLLANNHIMDYGKDGLVATITCAERNGLDIVGAGVDKNAAYKPLVKKLGGIKVGIINAGEAQFGVIDYFEREDPSGYAWINHAKIDENILSLKKECDFVVVFSHAGIENFSIPQKEWRERYKQLCNLGADVIIGSHPHVPQGYERHNDSLIFYSLGNFYFDGGNYSNSNNASFAVTLNLIKGLAPSFEPVFHETSDGQVSLVPLTRAVNLEALCEQLNDGYQKSHDEMSLKVYDMIKKQLSNSFMPIPTDGTLKGTVKEICATILGRRKNLDKSLTQLHFIRNEAYRYAMLHALELINEGQK